MAPAGGIDTLKAAVQAGADAVYMGAGRFSARANAKNFHGDALAEAVACAKANGVAVHLAVNTLITDRELPEAADLVGHALKIGVAAFIVQDLGLAAEIKRRFPEAELHASTQTTAKSLEDVRALAALGFSRVVLARELSRHALGEIAAGVKAGVKAGDTPVALEVFVHGALCASYSGQCLMSVFLGGRSANRGRCAQPCRLPYTHTRADAVGHKSAGAGQIPAPLLSLKDLCLIDHIPALKELGITSLKIEGRMKGPDYVRTVVSAYRAALDGAVLSEKEKQRLRGVFDRGGHTDGYFTGKRADMYTRALKNPYNAPRRKRP